MCLRKSGHGQSIQICFHREEIYIEKLLYKCWLPSEILRQSIDNRIELLHFQYQQYVERIKTTNQAVLQQ